MYFTVSKSAEQLSLKLMGISPLHGSHPAVPFAIGATIIERSLNLMLDGKENTHGITTSEKKTYTVDEIAALLNISMKSAYALVKSGQFHYIQPYPLPSVLHHHTD